MTDIVFSVPVFNQLPASEIRMLRTIADMAEEMCANWNRLTSPDWDEAEDRLSEIHSELVPLLAEYRQHYPARTADDLAPWPRRDPFDADARAIAQAIDDDDNAAYPLIAFL